MTRAEAAAVVQDALAVVRAHSDVVVGEAARVAQARQRTHLEAAGGLEALSLPGLNALADCLGRIRRACQDTGSPALGELLRREARLLAVRDAALTYQRRGPARARRDAT